jgi:hypothetical protein
MEFDFGPRIIVWYERSLRFWAASYKDRFGNQIGPAGYGPTKQEAIEDVKYQANIQKTKSARA